MFLLKRVEHGIIENDFNCLKAAEAESNTYRQNKESREMIQLVGDDRFHFNHGIGSMEVEVKTPENFDVCVTGANFDLFNPIPYQVSHLPPITLSFQCGAMYPSSAPPDIRLSCVWIASRELVQLESKLKSLWCLNEPVLKDMYTYVHENTLLMIQTEDFLLLDQDYFSNQGHFLECTEILQMILDFNAEYSVSSIKNTSTHPGHTNLACSPVNKSMTECKVCMNMTSHFECIFLSGCGHGFCADCVSSLLKHNIQEGTLKDCKCPETDCGQKIQPALVKMIVNEDMYARYERLLLDSCLGTMNDVVYCPLLNCQAAMVMNRNETQGECASCSHAFCLKCMKSAHEENVVCWQVEGEYLATDENGRNDLEAIYGKEKFRGVLDTTENEVWLKGNTRPCPRCSAAIEKDGGCSKMVCSQCNLKFCWECMESLSDLEDPYEHYWKEGNPCYRKLFITDED